MKYSLIVEHLKNQISAGNITSGQKMPSIRELCDKFECTKGTAVRAYYELKDEHLVYAVPNSGYYLIENINSKIRNNFPDINFSGTSLDLNALPYNEFQASINQAISKYKEKMFCYSQPQGLDSLIETLRKHLQNHQVFTTKERIFVTTGSQQTLDILGRMPFPNGKSNVVLEQPTYNGMIQALKLNNITTIGVTRNFKGLDFDSLERIFRNNNVKFFYTIPRFNNPIGLCYSNADKKKLVELAEKYDVYIVEDDFLGDLECNPKSTPIFSFDTSDRVIYVKTFSKVLLPGLRVALAVLPKILTNTFQNYKRWEDLNTNVLSQGALEIYLSSGMFDVHIKKIRDLYFNRMNYLKKVTESNPSTAVKWHIPSNGGFYAGIEILNSSSGKVVKDNLLKKDILISSMENFYLEEFFTDRILRMSIANANYTELDCGIPLIINEISNCKENYKKFVDL